MGFTDEILKQSTNWERFYLYHELIDEAAFNSLFVLQVNNS